MAYDPSKTAEVRAKYVQGLPLTTAAEVCGIPYNTARNWKRDSALQGDDWDIARNARHMSKSGMEDMSSLVLGQLAEQFLTTLEAIKKDPSMPAATRADILVKLMDGYSKAISASSKAMPNANRLAVAMDVVKFMTVFITNNFPKFREKFIEVSEAAGQDFVREFGSGA